MKLILETVDSSAVRFITEGSEGSKKLLLDGIFLQAEKRNRNGRIYPKQVLAQAVSKYVTEQVMSGRAVGELGHPDGPTVNLDKVSHRITELHWDGDNVMGKALILNTPMGKVVTGLVEGGVQLGVSSRGMGSLDRVGDAVKVKPDYILSTIDIVQNPSAPEAFVNGIMEGVEWFVKGNEIISEKIKETIHSTPSARLIEAQAQCWAEFLDEIATK